MLIGAYVEFVLLLFLPGAAFIELGRISSDSLGEKLGFAVGLGMAINVILMLFQASRYLGVGVVQLADAVLAVSALAIIVSFVVRRRIGLIARPTREDLLAMLLIVVQGLLVYAHYLVYPIFPQFQSVDFSSHVLIVTDIQKGNASPIPAGILYYGVYMLMVELLALTNGIPFLITQRTMEILVVLSPLLVYSAASVVSDSRRISLIATFIYVAGGFVWFGSVFNSGLYPNFYGILSSLFIIIAISAVLRAPRNPAGWAVYLLSIANALFSHYSTLTIFPAIVALPVVALLLTRRLDRVLLAVGLVPILLAALALAQYPSLVGTLEGFAGGGAGGNVASDTPLSLVLAGYPFLRYITVEVTSDTSTIFLLLMAAVGAYASLKAKNTIVLLPLMWLLPIAILSPANEGAWRFSYAGLLPLCLLAAFGFSPLLQRLQRRNAVRRRKGAKPWRERRLFTALVPIALILLIVGGSWGTLLLYDTIAQGASAGQAQRDVYYSMQWIGKNTPADSKLVSITDWRYTFMGLLEGRVVAYSPLTLPEDLLLQLNGTKHLYVALTALATVSSVSTNPIPLYRNDTRFKLVYQNPDVLVFLANATGIH